MKSPGKERIQGTILACDPDGVGFALLNARPLLYRRPRVAPHDPRLLSSRPLSLLPTVAAIFPLPPVALSVDPHGGVVEDIVPHAIAQHARIITGGPEMNPSENTGVCDFIQSIGEAVERTCDT